MKTRSLSSQKQLCKFLIKFTLFGVSLVVTSVPAYSSSSRGEPAPNPGSKTRTIKVSREVRDLKKYWNGINYDHYAIPYAGTWNRFLQYFGLERETKGKLITYYREENQYSFVSGKVSHFGGAKDQGVTIRETGAITGERLRSLKGNKDYYVAMRFDYGKKTRDGKNFWKNARLLLVNPKNGRAVIARPVDWGPHPRTKRIVDASPATLKYLGVHTDDSVWVSFAENGLETGPVRN